MAQLVKHPPAMWETWAQSLGWEDPLEKERLPTPVFWPRELQGLYIVHGVTKSWTQLIDSYLPFIKESHEVFICNSLFFFSLKE